MALVLPVLGLFLFVGYCSIVGISLGVKEDNRLAACDWRNPVLVSVNGHEMAIRAGVFTSVYPETRNIRGEKMISNPRSRAAGFYRAKAFCMREGDPNPVPVRHVSYGLRNANELADRLDLSYKSLAQVHIRSNPSTFYGGPEADPHSQNPTRMIGFEASHDGTWQYFVTEGVSDEGFRIGAWCITFAWQEPGFWLCKVAVQDAQLDLAYTYEGREYEITDFDGQDVPEGFLVTARKMRQLVTVLQEDALKISVP